MTSSIWVDCIILGKSNCIDKSFKWFFFCDSYQSNLSILKKQSYSSFFRMICKQKLSRILRAYWNTFLPPSSFRTESIESSNIQIDKKPWPLLKTHHLWFTEIRPRTYRHYRRIPKLIKKHGVGICFQRLIYLASAIIQPT